MEEDDPKPQRRTIAATKFRESFSDCMKKIEEHGDTYVIEKHGNPTAVITPYNPLLHSHPIDPNQEGQPLDPVYYAADRRYPESAQYAAAWLSRATPQQVKDLVEYLAHKEALAKHGDPKKADYLEFLEGLSPSFVKRLEHEEDFEPIEEDSKSLERQRMEAKARKNQPSANPLNGASSVNKKK